jgi:hypothetical protein
MAVGKRMLAQFRDRRLLKSACLQGLFRPALRLPVFRLAYLTLNRAGKANCLAFQEKVVGARLHQLDGGFFAHHAGNNDEWDIDAFFFKQF